MSHQVFRFGRYRLDAAAHELWCDHERVALPPKSFECLAYLLEHRHRTVGRDELISAVWGRTDVADTVLAQTLLRARRAVGDTGGEQTVVRTVPRFGYRWVAAVDTVDATASTIGNTVGDDVAASAKPELAGTAAAEPKNVVDDPPATAIEKPLPHRQRPRWPWAIATAALLSTIVLGSLAVRQPRRPAPPPANAPAQEKTEAHDLFIVLPVSLPNASAETAWIRLGAMDYVASRLREDAKLQVLPSDQVVALLGSNKSGDPRAAEALRHLELTTGASYILAPRASYSGGDWHFAFDVYHDGAMRSFEASSGAPLQAAGGVVARFLESIGSTPGTAPRPEPAALTELLKRVDAAMLSSDLGEARRLVETAPANLRNEPSFAIRAGRVAGRTGRLKEAEQVLRPLALDDPNLPVEIRAQAKNYLGGAAARNNDFDAAEREYTGAIATLGDRGRPDLLGWAYMGRGLATGSLDRFDAALIDFGRARIAFERAGDLLNVASLDTNAGIVEARRGRYADAVSAYDRAIAVFTRFNSRDNLAIALFDKTDAQLNLLDLPAALASSAQGWDLASSGLEDPFLVRRLGVARIRSLLACGQLKAATELIEHFHQLGSPDAGTDPEFALMRARLLSEQGNFAAALTEAEAIVGRIEQPSDPTDIATLSEVGLILIEAAIRTGDVGKAEHMLARLQTAPTPAKDNERAFTLALAQAEVSAARGDVAAAGQFDKAIAVADRMVQPFAVVTAGVAYARYLIGRHQLEDASAVVGRLAPYIERDYRAARAAAALYKALGDQRLAQVAEAKVRALAGERNPDLPF